MFGDKFPSMVWFENTFGRLIAERDLVPRSYFYSDKSTAQAHFVRLIGKEKMLLAETKKTISL
jgi:hypothetical protein